MTGRARDRGRVGSGRPKGTDYFTRHPDAADAVEAILARQRLAAPRILELLATRFSPTPGIATLRRFMMRLETERPALLASTRDPDLFKSKYRLALGRADGGVTRVHQRWEIDTTKADVMTVGGRCMILGIIDVFSRQARFMVAPSESGQSVRRILIDTIAAWGAVPEQLGTDNGSGYINRSIVSALDILGIEHRPCAPGSPERKPYIERLFGTFTRERAPLLPGFTGHNVADASRLRGRARKETGRAVIEAAMTAAELQAVLSAWVDGVYHVRRHGSLGMSPLQKAFTSLAPARRAPDAAVLRMALSAFAGSYVVGKRGIQWKGGKYWSAALVPYIGRSVEVRRDEDDLGALLVFADDGRFIDTAINHERAGMSEEAFAMAARRQQAALMTEARADIRAKQRRFDIDTAVAERLRMDAEAAGKVTALPLATRAHSTPTLDSLRAAPVPALPTAAEVERAIARSPARIVPLPAAAPSVADKVAAADRCMADADSGIAVDADALIRARRYAASSEYRAHKMVAASFSSPARGVSA